MSAASKTGAELKVVYRQLVKQVHVDDIASFGISSIKKIGHKFPGLETSKFSIQYIDDDNRKVEIKTDKDLIQAFVVASSRSFLRVMLVPIEKNLLDEIENESENGSDFELVDHSSSDEEEEINDDDNQSENEENGNVIIPSSSYMTSSNEHENSANDEEIVQDETKPLETSFEEESKAPDSNDGIQQPSTPLPPLDDEVLNIVSETSPKLEVNDDVAAVEQQKEQQQEQQQPEVVVTEPESNEAKTLAPSEPIRQVAEEAIKAAAPHEAAALLKALKAVIHDYSQRTSSQGNASLPKLREALSLVLSDASIVGDLQQTIGTEQVKKFVVDVFTAEKHGTDIWEAASAHLVPMLEVISNVMQNHPQLFALVPIVVIFLMDLMNDKPSSANASSEQTPNNKPRTPAIVHKRVFCDGCKAKNPDHREYITGIRYKSAMVEDFDLCEDCEAEGTYNQTHGPFLKIYSPSQAPESILCILKDDDRNRNTKFGQFAERVMSTVPEAASENIFVDANGNDAENILGRVASVHANATAQAAATIPFGNNSSVSASMVSESVQRATSKTLKCPSNHILNSFETPVLGYRCDVCDTRPNVGENMMGCRTCDFDVCATCADNIPGPEIRLMKYNCPGMHPLKRHLASHPGYTCDNCMFRPGLNGALYGCRICNFDLCVRCQEESTQRSFEISRNLRPAYPATTHRPQAKFIKDITFKDGSIVSPGQTFVKTWKIENNSKISWPNGCRLIHVGGERLNMPLSGVHVRSLSPGEQADISVTFVAPAQPGRANGYFRFLTPDNQRFGCRIWVDITVDGSIGETIAASIAGPFRKMGDIIVSKVQEFEINKNQLTSAIATSTTTTAVAASASTSTPATNSPAAEEKQSNQSCSLSSSLSDLAESEIAFGQVVSTQNEYEKMRKYEIELQSLIEMGFTDIERNVELLEQNQGSLEGVLTAYLQQ